MEDVGPLFLPSPDGKLVLTEKISKALRRRLVELAKVSEEQQIDSAVDEAQVLTARMRAAEAELELITLNLGRAHDQAEYGAVKRLFHATRQDLASLCRELDKLNPRQADSNGEEGDAAEIEKALAAFGQIESLGADDGAREALRPLFRRLDLNMWSNFGEGRKGSRAARVLTGGMVTTGNTALPRKPYGEDADDDASYRAVRPAAPCRRPATQTKRPPSVLSEQRTFRSVR